MLLLHPPVSRDLLGLSQAIGLSLAFYVEEQVLPTSDLKPQPTYLMHLHIAAAVLQDSGRGAASDIGGEGSLRCLTEDYRCEKLTATIRLLNGCILFFHVLLVMGTDPFSFRKQGSIVPLHA